MKPYRITHIAPKQQDGIVFTKATNGEKNESTMAITAVQMIVATEAFLVTATQAIDSP